MQWFIRSSLSGGVLNAVMTSSSLDRLPTALITIGRLSDRRLPRNRRSGCRQKRNYDQFPAAVSPKKRMKV